MAKKDERKGREERREEKRREEKRRESCPLCTVDVKEQYNIKVVSRLRFKFQIYNIKRTRLTFCWWVWFVVCATISRGYYATSTTFFPHSSSISGRGKRHTSYSLNIYAASRTIEGRTTRSTLIQHYDSFFFFHVSSAPPPECLYQHHLSMLCRRPGNDVTQIYLTFLFTFL